MLRWAVCIVVILSGCAVEPPAPKLVAVFKQRTCTITIRPMSKSEFCRTPKSCPDISTCGEAYYRYTMCREIERDGGVAGSRNGIPCEKMCGRTALEMAAKISGESPFSPPMKSEAVCNPV